MSAEKQSTQITVDVGWIKHLGGLKKAGIVTGKLAPIVLMFIAAEAWALKTGNSDIQTLLVFMGIGTFLTFILLIFDMLASQSDFAVFLDVHGNIEPIDRDAQTEIYEGLQQIKFVEETTGSEIDLAVRTVNDIAIAALTPSAYHNHHGKELVDSGYEMYIDRKKKAVHRAFSRSPMGYMQIASDMSPDHSFDTAVDVFVRKWIHEEVIPAVKNACKLKIEYYQRIISTKKGISRGFKAKVQEWLSKNEGYIKALDELYAQNRIGDTNNTIS